MESGPWERLSLDNQSLISVLAKRRADGRSSLRRSRDSTRPDLSRPVTAGAADLARRVSA